MLSGRREKICRYEGATRLSLWQRTHVGSWTDMRSALTAALLEDLQEVMQQPATLLDRLA